MSRNRLALIVVAFLVTRFLVMGLYSPELDRGDQRQYVRVADSILDHGFANYLEPGFVIEKGSYFPYFRGSIDLPDGEYNPIFWDPLYPLFVSVVFALTGSSHDALRVVQIGLSLWTLFIGMSAVRRMFPDLTHAPETFAWLNVAYLPFAGFATKIMSETLDTFLLASLVWMATRLPRQRALDFLGFGLLLGLYAQVKSYFLPLTPLVLALLVWLWWKDRQDREQPPAVADWRRLVVSLALLLAGFVLVLTPTAVRNYHISGGYLVLSTKGPWNLWKDANNLKIVRHDWREQNVRVHTWLAAYYRLGSAERVSPKLAGVYYDETRPIVRPPCDALLDELASCERREAIRFILQDPLRFAVRAIHKNASQWSPNNYIFNRAPPGPVAWHQNYRVELPTFVRYALQLWVMLLYLAVMFAFFVGITAAPANAAHRYASAFVALSLVFLVLVVVSIGHGVSRYRLAFMLPISMFAVLGFARVRSLRDDLEVSTWSGRLRTGTLAVLVLALLALGAAKLPLLLAP